VASRGSLRLNGTGIFSPDCLQDSAVDVAFGMGGIETVGTARVATTAAFALDRPDVIADAIEDTMIYPSTAVVSARSFQALIFNRKLPKPQSLHCTQ
jgi:hypothetical protein